MLPWYRREGMRITAIALGAGVLLGGLIALAVSGPKLSPFGTPQRSAAEAIASDQPKAHKPAAKGRTKPQAKHAQAVSAQPVSADAPAVAATPDAADRSDRAKAKAKVERGDRAPRRAAAPAPVAQPRRRSAAPRAAPRRRPAPAAPSPKRPSA